MSELVALRGQIVEILYGRKLYILEIRLGTRAADYPSNVIGRTRGSAQALHLLNHEGKQTLGCENCLCFLIEVGFVRRTAALGDEEEIVRVGICGVNVDLRGKIALRVHLVPHR